ncbi:hypothetical protein ACELLULO517_07085 [Acidisoma cellulosilytica]|uniref:Uncharacterized protein n=1 Tax=Acidisoma cellulosilyticum TaxID=2802395 RepID=A0A964E3J0_9PROT|nr:hypothetical protein [Acidisoma cellulosilyticum]MCB8879993.1 hypothetical protein [Acidisoma cellulosilyticum]
MDDTDPSLPVLGPHAQRAKDKRDAQRAAALRANLRRRKVQERGRDEDAQAQPVDDGGAEPHNAFPHISD